MLVCDAVVTAVPSTHEVFGELILNIRVDREKYQNGI